MCPIILIFGYRLYTISPPQGSVLSASLRLWRMGMKGRWALNPFQTYRNMTADDFWENVKPSRFQGEDRPAWMTFDDQWVDEVKRGFKACSVFCWYPIYCACLPTSFRPERTAELLCFQGSRTTSSTTT